MLQPIDHALAVVLSVLFPIRAALWGFRRLRLSPPERLIEARRSVYREATILQWSLVAAVIAWWLARDRHWYSLGLELRPTGGFIGVAIATVVATLLLWRQRSGAWSDDQALALVRKRVRHIEVLLPHRRDELPRFSLLALTAGICEEILYRGYLLWYAAQWFDRDPIAGAAISSAVFGIGHVYQGAKGILQTALVGAFLATVYLVTGSIYPSMALHALIDWHSGRLVQRAFEREAEAPADEAGAPAAPDGGESAATSAPQAGEERPA